MLSTLQANPPNNHSLGFGQAPQCSVAVPTVADLVEVSLGVTDKVSKATTLGRSGRVRNAMISAMDLQ